MTLHQADARLRAVLFGVRTVPVAERGRWPWVCCSRYGNWEELEDLGACENPIRFIRYPDEEFYFAEDGLLCRACYMRLAENEGVRG